MNFDKQDIVNQIGMIKCTLKHLGNKKEVIDSPKLINNLVSIKDSIEIIEEGVHQFFDTPKEKKC